jgi:hypothetical protein
MTIKLNFPVVAAMTPMAKSIESPGSNGIITKPVSTKTTKNKIK